MTLIGCRSFGVYHDLDQSEPMNQEVTCAAIMDRLGKTMQRLLVLNQLPWYARLPAKWAVFGSVVLVVCFPNPKRLISHIDHWRDPNALIEPDATAIRPLVEELRPQMTADLSPREALQRVEDFVYEKLPYEWDWNTWGTVDYLPTVTEAIEMGREDCDGRAVLAASLLRHFGFKTEIVTDFSHVWVKTDKGETMGPGKNKAVIATKNGLQIQWSALAEIPRATAYGVGVFPLGRELIILGVMWLLLLPSHGKGVWMILGLAALAGGLVLVRTGSAAYLQPTVWMQWLGATLFVGGIAVLLLRAPKRPRGARKTLSEIGRQI